jgi:hypothetical protein
MSCGSPLVDVRSSGFDPANPCLLLRELRPTAISLSQPEGPYFRVPVSGILYVLTASALKFVSKNHLRKLFPSGIPATNGSILIRTFDDLYRVRAPGVKTLSDFPSRFDPYGRFAEVRRGAYVNTDHAAELDRDRSAVYFTLRDGTKESIISARRNLLKFD